MAIQAAPTIAPATRSTSHRLRARDNMRMARVSQGLIEFANHFRQPPSPGVEITDTPRYRITLQPDYPIPGPNGVSWIRCAPGEADDVIDEVHATVSPRHLPLMWLIDPDTTPADFADDLAAHCVFPEPEAPEVAVMVLPIDASIDPPTVDGLAMHDALASPEAFRSADRVNGVAFGDPERGSTPEQMAAQERRRHDFLAAGNRRVLLATVDGEPAGSAGLTLYPPAGAIINGGAVMPEFRGRGIYRALLAARLEMARQAGAGGVAVWGGPMSAPILAKVGFEKVGWRRFYLDRSTA